MGTLHTKETASQAERILNHMRQRGSISPLEALQEYGCFRLGARIWDLKQAGHAINTRIVEENGKHFARYELAPDQKTQDGESYASDLKRAFAPLT